jgi:hypothetical protein
MTDKKRKSVLAEDIMVCIAGAVCAKYKNSRVLWGDGTRFLIWPPDSPVPFIITVQHQIGLPK